MRIKDNLFSLYMQLDSYRTKEFQWHMHHFAMQLHTKHRLIIYIFISYNTDILKWSTWVKIPNLII